jgi:hypothetical protein
LEKDFRTDSPYYRDKYRVIVKRRGTIGNIFFNIRV